MAREGIEQNQEIVVGQDVTIELTDEEMGQVGGGLLGLDGTHN